MSNSHFNCQDFSKLAVLSQQSVMLRIILFLLLSVNFTNNLYSQDIFMTRKGKVTFVSEAPLEIISASSEELFGAVDLINNRFAFKITIRSLKGFNSALQQEHFYENYMEDDKFKYSTFEGKIIEPIIKVAGEKQIVRTKGILSIHGEEQERIITVQLDFTDDAIFVDASFNILLEDFNIRIPSIVNQKIAELITIKVKAELLPKVYD